MDKFTEQLSQIDLFFRFLPDDQAEMIVDDLVRPDGVWSRVETHVTPMLAGVSARLPDAGWHSALERAVMCLSEREYCMLEYLCENESGLDYERTFDLINNVITGCTYDELIQSKRFGEYVDLNFPKMYSIYNNRSNFVLSLVASFKETSQLNGNNGEWTNSDDVIEALLKSSWLYNLLIFLKFLVTNSHRFIYMLLSIAIKLYAVKLTFSVLYNTLKIGFLIETNFLSYMGSLTGYIQLLLIYNLINFLFDVESDFTNIKNIIGRKAVVSTVRSVTGIQEEEVIEELFHDYLGHYVGGGKGNTSKGKGKKLVSNKIKNKGTGGKSKLSKEPVSFVEPITNNLEIIDELSKEEDFKNFIFSDFPKLRTRFKENELVANARFVDFDCHGAPFCGVVCIDIAVGVKPDIEKYIERASACERPTDLGTNEFLVEYANHRGVNLAIILNQNNNVVINRFVNSPNWDYVCIKFNQPIEGDIGHWTLLCSNNQFVVTGKREDPLEMLGVRMDQEEEINVGQWFYGLIQLTFCFAITEIVVDYDCEDKREVTHKRDPSEMDDCYFRLNSTYKIKFVGFGIEFSFTETPITSAIQHVDHFVEAVEAGFLILNGNLPDYCRLNFLLVNGQTIIYWLAKFFVNHFLRTISSQGDCYYANLYHHYLPVRGCLISFQKFKKAYLEAQTLPVENRMLALSLISQSRYLNSNMQIPLVLSNTIRFTTAMISGLPHTRPIYNIRRVAVNANNARSVIANQSVIADNQNVGLAAVGAGRISGRNFVKKAKIRKVVANRVVAQSPTISFVNHGKQLGPGQICVTDDLGLLAAFCGRSMSKDPSKINKESMEDFVEFSKRFINRVVDSMDFSSVKQEDPREAIVRLYKGKKPEKFIESLVKGYSDYLSGKQSKNYSKPSCFNKMENSAKIVDDKIRTKPRLIMVMSELMLMEYSQVLDVISVWNESFIKRFQIKHESEDQVIKKIIEVTSKNHMVTDYSSFECSLIGKVKEIENYCIIRCLRRAGLTVALKRFTRDFSKPRVLENKEMHFYIDSRNSGDFHTSWMNGLVNVLIGAYTYAKRYPEDKEFVNFNMIAEGDDGLRKPLGNDEVIAKELGFGFSMSTVGSSPGDVDFLRSRWISGKRYLNIARCLKIAWTLSGKPLSRTKSKQIQRCAALSLHAISPGHPVLWAIVKRIMIETKPNVLSNKMHEYFKHTSYNNKILSFEELKKLCSSSMPEYTCDETMRQYVALGARDFPPISIAQQLALERMILDRSTNIINLMGIFDDYEDTKVYSEGTDWIIDQNYSFQLSPEMKELLPIVNAKISKSLKIIDGCSFALKYEANFGK